jgi:hypothetical protein
MGSRKRRLSGMVSYPGLLLSRFVNYLEGARGGRLLVDLFLPDASHVTLMTGGLVGPCRPVVSCGPATDW